MFNRLPLISGLTLHCRARCCQTLSCRALRRLTLPCLFLCGLLSGGLSPFIPAVLCAAERPNFVILLCDDMGYGDLGCFGHPQIQSPHLDQLALDGVRLTDCYSSAPICSPSRAGLLSGRIPTRSGIYSWIAEHNPMQLRAGIPTISGLLKTAGYDTCHVGKWHVNGEFNSPAQAQPPDHGFDYWFATQNNAIPSHRNPQNFVRNGTAVGEISGYSCQIVAEEATRWLRSREEPQKPFFLNVWFHETHEPVDSPDELVAKYPQARNRDEAEYFANVTNMDHAVGRLLETLAELHLDDNTLVFFTSDNGPETLLRYKKANRSYGSAAPLRGMKLFLYEGGIRVPGILRWPGRISPGQIDSTPVCALDLLPTFCELAGVTVPANLKLDGVSLVPWLEGKSLMRPQPLFWHYYGGEQQRQVALRDGDWKIVAWSDQPVVKGSGSTFKPGILPGLKQSKLVGCELYHISTDPQETEDLAGQEPERARRMLAAAEQIYARALAEGPDWFHELPPKTGTPLKSDAEPDQTPAAMPDAKPQAVPAAEK